MHALFYPFETRTFLRFDLNYSDSFVLNFSIFRHTLREFIFYLSPSLPSLPPSPYHGPIPSKSMKTVGMYIHNQILLKYYFPYSVSCDSIFSAWTFETLSFHIFSPFRRLLQPFTYCSSAPNNFIFIV